MKNMDSKMIGTPAMATKVLKVVAVVLVIYAILRLMVFTGIFTGFGDVAAAVMIALICGYFAGKSRREQREQEVEDEDDEMLAEAPVLAEPVAHTEPAVEPVAPVKPATEPVAPVEPAAATTPVVDYDNLQPDDLDAFDRADRDRKVRLIRIGMERKAFNADSAKLDEAKKRQAELLAEGEKAVK